MSVDMMEWIRDGYLNGNPIATMAFIGMYAVGGVWTLITGGSW
ncbi:hypothetical protein [Jongsikchunia kroppenstedtii]|nr:hypothetical protein [Jongsikchunia kroppenstedtii]